MSRFKLIASGDTRMGGRECNEDRTFGQLEKKGNFFAVFDGHCGEGAASYACHNLWDNIKNTKEFDSDKPEKIMDAIKEGFKKTQEDMLGKSPFLH